MYRNLEKLVSRQEDMDIKREIFARTKKSTLPRDEISANSHKKIIVKSEKCV
jgi:hypothetical protein